MKKIVLMVAGALIVPFLAFGLIPSQNASAQVSSGGSGSLDIKSGVENAKGNKVPEKMDGDQGIVKLVINILLYIVGAIAVIMMIVGGIRYTTSNGDSNNVTAAKNTIMYSVIGLVVAIFAYAIVNFVIDKTATGN